jgi:MFS transporter, NNP family, nitrate/nitrite transporter
MITGILGAAGGMGGFFVPNILGTLKEVTGTYSAGFLVYFCVGLLAMGILISAKISWRKTWVLKSDTVKI